MSSNPKNVKVRVDTILQLVGSAEFHAFPVAGFDEGVFLFDYETKHADAILSIKFAFADVRDQAAGAGDWYDQMYAPDDAVAALVVKEYTYTPGAIGTFFFSLPLPLMDSAVRIEVSESSTTKGDLKIDAVGTTIGRH